MFHLTREVRFAISAEPGTTPGVVHNGYAGWPPLQGLGHFFRLAVTVGGDLEAESNYLVNIKQIDQMVRQAVVPLFEGAIRRRTFGQGCVLLHHVFAVLRDAFQPRQLHKLVLHLSPHLSLAVLQREYPMVRLSQKFEFSASHRLHNPSLSDEENRRVFGKCSNPHGHGHNYELQVTLRGEAGDNGVLIEVPLLERIVAETVIERLDHKNLNVEVAEFRNLIPSVENIAAVIFRLLRPQFEEQRSQLACVTVWETPKTWCEYSEG